MASPITGQTVVPMPDVAAKEESVLCCLGDSCCKCARVIAFPLMGGTIVFSAAGALWGYFGTTLTTPFNAYTVALDTLSVFGIAYSLWMYKKNLPQKDLEDNIALEQKGNQELANTEHGVDQSLNNFDAENKRLNDELTVMQNKIGDLQKQFDAKTKRLAKATTKLKQTADELSQSKVDLTAANKTIEQTKALIISMGKTSEAMIASMKTVGIAEDNLKKDEDQLDKEDDKIGQENDELSKLVHRYADSIDQAHKQLQTFIDAYQKLKGLIDQIKQEDSELKSDGDNLKEGTASLDKDIDKLGALIKGLRSFKQELKETDSLVAESKK